MTAKRPHSLVLCALLLALSPMLAWAGETITLWHKEESELSRRTLEELCDMFAEQHNVAIETTRIDPTELAPVLIKNTMDGSGPDVAFVPADLVGHYRELKLSPISEELQSPDVKPLFLDTAKLQTTLYGAPILGGNHLMMYYNKRYVDKPARNWDELFAQHEKFQKMEIKTIGWHYSEPFWFVGFVGAFGGWPITEGQITLDTRALKDALIFYKSLADWGVIDKDCDYSCGAQRFYNGEYAYAINGDWAYSDVEKALGKDFGVAMIPAVGDRVVTPMFATTALVFPNQSLEGKKAAILKAFMRFMQGAEVQEHWYKAAGRFPVHSDVFQQFLSTADDNRKQALAELEVARIMPNDPNMAYIWQGLRKGMARFLTGTIDVGNVTDVMQKFVDHQRTKQN
jgi:maltose-binding protein MalE